MYFISVWSIRVEYYAQSHLAERYLRLSSKLHLKRLFAIKHRIDTILIGYVYHYLWNEALKSYFRC